MTIGAARTPLALLIDLLASYAGVAVIVAAFGQGDGPAPSFVAVAVVVLGSFALARGLQASGIEQDAMRIAGVAASLVVLFVLARVEYAPGEWIWDPGWLSALMTDAADTIQPNAHVIAGLVALVPLWIRGVIRGQSPIEFDSVLTSASVGMLAVIIAALAAPDTREAVSWGAFALVYAAVALLALAVYQSPEPDASLASFARRWTTAGAAIGGLAVAVAMLTAALDPESFGFLAPIGEPMRFAGNLLGTYVLGPVLWLVSQPFVFLGWLFGALLPDNDPSVPEEPAPIEQEERDPDDRREQPLWFRLIVYAVGGAVLTAIAVIALMLLWTAFRRFARPRQRDPRERRESIEPASSLAADLGDMFGALARRFRRPPRPAQAVQIRRLYFEMLDAAASRGITRPPAATPLQFAPHLDEYFSSAVPSSISRAFAESRYGELPIDADEVRLLQSRWQALREGFGGPARVDT